MLPSGGFKEAKDLKRVRAAWAFFAARAPQEQESRIQPERRFCQANAIWGRAVRVLARARAQCDRGSPRGGVCDLSSSERGKITPISGSRGRGAPKLCP